MHVYSEDTYDTHAFPGSNECRDANHKSNSRKCPPPSTGFTEGDENGTNDTTKDAGNTETAGEDNTGLIAVANCPSNEVGMGLVT